MPGPVQPVALVSVQDQQLEERPERPDIANVEDALVEAEVQVEEVDPKVAEAAAAMERVTVEKPANVNKGSAGKAIKVTSNYIRFVDQVTCIYKSLMNVFRLELAEEEKKMYEYEVKFQPTVDSKDQRFKLIRAQSEVLGPVRNFDGVFLSLPFLLKDLPTTLHGELPETNTAVQLTITLKHVMKLSDPKSVQFYNVLFRFVTYWHTLSLNYLLFLYLRRIMGKLKMVEMNKNFYQPANAHMVPQHKLEIWPGYVTAVQEYEGGLMLNLDVSHKVLRTQTAHQLVSFSSFSSIYPSLTISHLDD